MPSTMEQILDRVHMLIDTKQKPIVKYIELILVKNRIQNISVLQKVCFGYTKYLGSSCSLVFLRYTHNIQTQLQI